MMPDQVEKLQAHAGHLLDGFLQLRERYAILKPILYGGDPLPPVIPREARRGLDILRQSLLFSCVHDIAKLTLDADRRTPSIRNIVGSLSDESVRATLQSQFAIWHLPSANEITDPEILDALKRIELREQTERQAQFEELWCELTTTWTSLSTDAALKGFLLIRDKVTAHTEIRFIADKYQLFDIGSLHLKYGDLDRLVAQTQRSVELIGLIVRNTTFSWEDLDGDLSMAAQNLWSMLAR
jgi:hypothetical protein